MPQQIQTFYDERTWTLTYLVWDDQSLDAVVIDPVLDYEPAASKIWTESVDAVANAIEEKSLNLLMILETHAHADHLSGSQVLKKRFPKAQVAIGRPITAVQTMFKGIFDLPEQFATDGSQFDMLLEPGQTYQAGTLSYEVIPSPGHTPACVTFRMEDALFTGDLLFMPDMGTGRCDFPGGSANDMYDSIMALYELDDDLQVYVGHDYQPGGRELEYVSSLGEQKENNVALPKARTREDFVTWRQARDASLAAPKLLFQSVQVNVDAGTLPKQHGNNVAYLKIPINVFKSDPDVEAQLSYGDV